MTTRKAVSKFKCAVLKLDSRNRFAGPNTKLAGFGPTDTHCSVHSLGDAA